MLLPAAVLSKMEYLRLTWTFADRERSLKGPPANGRGRTYSDSMRGGRAPKNKSLLSSHYPIAKAPVASRSKREREREPRRRMMMENKRGVEPYAEDDDREQRLLDVV